MVNSIKVFVFILSCVVFLAPNARAFYKYLNSYQSTTFAAYGIALFGFLFAISSRKFSVAAKEIIESQWFFLTIIIAMIILIWYAYPIADGLKLQMRGSDQDDCVIIGASRLANFLNPYTERSYQNSLCSPGPGMLLIYLPFVMLDVYQFGAIFFILCALCAIKCYTGELFSAGKFLLLICSSIFFLELLVVGSDLIFIGCAIALLALGLVVAIENRSMPGLILMALLAGVVSSTRVNFIVIFPLLSIFIFLHWRQGSCMFLIISFTFAIIPSLLIYMQDPGDFSPLHLIGKSNALLPREIKLLTFFVSTFLIFAGFYLVRLKLRFLPLAFFMSLAPSLVSVSVGDLLARERNIAAWEGANYLMPLLPLAVCLIISLSLETRRKQQPAQFK